jgi:hypothetical protein
VENDGELSRRVLCHEKAFLFEFRANASRYYRGSVGVASERLQLHQVRTFKCRFPCTPNGRLWHFGHSPQLGERLFLAADSTGRCNTLSEQHCSAKMYLNQKNSQRFKGTPGPIAGTTGSLNPVTAPITC